MTTAPGFTGSPLDRADRLRHDADALAAAMADPRARLLRLVDFEPEVDGEGRLGWTTLADARPEAELLLLGLIDGVAHVAAFVPGMRSPGYRSPTLFAALGAMRAGEAATYGTARSLIDWHGRHQFCANCGQPTAIFRAGWGRQCAACGTEHFPRTDPVVIMIAEHDGRALLGRQRSWPAGRYSALAGFLEPGESIEEAVAREIGEEAGVPTAAVRYVASQPWPFPCQLMIGCIAQALDDTITLDTHELEDARWFTRAEVRAALAGAAEAAFVPPPAYAIARTLLNLWVES